MERTYIAIDLKSFYASVECVERGYDPFDVNLVVADASRTDKTICLAVSPALKSYGVAGRPRLFEVFQKVRELNIERRRSAPKGKLQGKSFFMKELQQDPALELDFVIAPPQMARYIAVSTQVYEIYLRYVAPEDMHVYSIDEVFIDVTSYLHTYQMSARELAMTMIREVLKETGITATVGIGTNLYLCKIAMDIEAKHLPADENGVRIAELDEIGYRKKLWNHRPLRDFWRIGRGYSKKLEDRGIFTMGDIARVSVHNEDIFYKMFGINAELLIDHAWGWEPCTIRDVRSYQPKSNSFSSGQVLTRPYQFAECRVVLLEMAERMALDLVEQDLVTDQIVLTISYDVDNLKDPERMRQYEGIVVQDHYGRSMPRHAHGSRNLPYPTSSTKLISETTVGLYEEIVNSCLLLRRINLTVNHVVKESSVQKVPEFEQMDLFGSFLQTERERSEMLRRQEQEKRWQQAIIEIRNRYGKNAVLKGISFLKGATARERNQQIGGHRA